MLYVTPKGIEITNRFFEAIAMLKAQKRIRGLHTFTKEYELNYWNICTIRDHPERTYLKPELIYYLVTGYGISADWIITGRGGMFEDKKISKNLS